jgi:hypothetical protein
MSERSIDRLIGFFEVLARRFVDNSDFNGLRLKSIEDRVAQLDGGSDANGAKLTAYEAINAERRGTGKVPLGFKLK